MITGYNTDVEHNGVIYHVQTEDKGLESPLILSLVYSGGAILASKRSPYRDLIASGFDEAALAERLKRQHRLICAAVHAGRINELRRLGKEGDAATADEAEEVVSEAPRMESEPTLQEAMEGESVVSQPTSPEETYPIHDLRRQSPLGELPAADEGLVISLLDEQEFRSGDSFTLRIMVGYRSNDGEKPIGGVEVSVKVLGTTFRPVIHSMKTQSDGVARVAAQIPKFTSGRAAVLIRAAAAGRATELRRVIHPGK